MTTTLNVGSCFAFKAHGVNYHACWEIVNVYGEDFMLQKWEFGKPAYPAFRANRFSLNGRFKNGEFFIVPSPSSKFDIET